MKVKENKETKAGKDARIIEYLNFAEYYLSIIIIFFKSTEIVILTFNI